jgi:hypothetical protein
VETLLGMVIDRSPKVFKVTTRTAIVSSELRVRSTTHASYIGQHFTAPPFHETCEPFVKLGLVGLAFAAIVVVD